MERDRYPPLAAECEHWLRTEVAVAYDALKADPTRGLAIDDVRANLVKARRDREAAASSCGGNGWCNYCGSDVSRDEALPVKLHHDSRRSHKSRVAAAYEATPLLRPLHTLPERNMPANLFGGVLRLRVVPGRIGVDRISDHHVVVVRRAFPRTYRSVAGFAEVFARERRQGEIVVVFDYDRSVAAGQGGVVPDGLFHWGNLQ